MLASSKSKSKLLPDETLVFTLISNVVLCSCPFTSTTTTGIVLTPAVVLSVIAIVCLNLPLSYKLKSILVSSLPPTDDKSM